MSEHALVAHLAELRELVADLDKDLPNVNDFSLQPSATTLVEAADVVLTLHGDEPKPTIADDLAGLMSGVRAFKIPARDPDLGRTVTLDRLRKNKGLIIASLADALDAAAKIGLHPQSPPLPQELAAALPRAEIEGLLRGILRRLEEVEKSLDALDEANAISTPFAQQTGLLNFYTGSMHAEVDIAKLHLKVGERTVDFNAVARAVETMADLTRDFVATVRAWTGRIADSILTLSREVPRKVRRVSSGIASTVKWVLRTVKRGHKVDRDEASGNLNRENTSQIADVDEPAIDEELIVEMILRGEPVQRELWPRIKKLSFFRTEIEDISPLSGFIYLEELDLEGTRVSNLTPLSGLVNLQWLDLAAAQVSDVSPLTSIQSLVGIDLSSTKILDIGPLSRLKGLQWLGLANTSISSIDPLANLVGLKHLDLSNTSVSNIAALAGLHALEFVDLSQTQVTEVGVVSSFENLRSLDLSDTMVGELPEFSPNSRVESLRMPHTLINDLRPLRNLRRLKRLDVQDTSVSDLTSLAGLTELEYLDLDQTGVEDISALGSLLKLEQLGLSETKVKDISVLAHANTLRHLEINNTMISNLQPLSRLPKLRVLYVDNVTADVTSVRHIIEGQGLKAFKFKRGKFRRALKE